MSDIELPSVITAIASATTEGFIASTLFAQGWSIVFRAIDIDSLENFILNNSECAETAILIFAPDLPGVTRERIDAITLRVKQILGFSETPSEASHLGEMHRLPQSDTDLVSLVRGFVRAPMLRQSTQVQHKSRKAHVLAIGSAGSNTGCTTLAINIAMELSVLTKSTLLIDANFRAPSIATLLAIRNVKSEAGWRTIAPLLSIAEITQDQVTSVEALMERATDSFERIIIDLGSISGLSNRLTDRRWTSGVTTWTCDLGDELMVVARPDVLGFHRLEQVSALIETTSIRSGLSFTLNMRSQGRKGAEEEARFLAITAPLRPLNVRTIARDSRAVHLAESQKSTLIEANDRSTLRRSIAKIATEIEH
jgi:MinD-like ATPase involved in chromosome partitioning or flagellar assembly